MAAFQLALPGVHCTTFIEVACGELLLQAISKGQRLLGQLPNRLLHTIDYSIKDLAGTVEWNPCGRGDYTSTAVLPLRCIALPSTARLAPQPLGIELKQGRRRSEKRQLPQRYEIPGHLGCLFSH